MKIRIALLLSALLPTVALADYESDKKKYDECVEKVKKEHALPPASMNALKQLVLSLCGTAPTPPPRPKK